MIFPFNENVNIDGVCEKIGHSIDAILWLDVSLPDEHFISCLRIAISSYQPQYDKLVADIQCQISTKRSE